MNRRRMLGVGLLGMAFLPTAGRAQTSTPSCGDTSVLPNPVYLAGSSAFEPSLAKLAVVLRAKQGISIIYSPIASCAGVSQISDPTLSLGGTGHYFTVDPSDPMRVMTNNCTIPSGMKASVGVSDVSYASCLGEAMPATVSDTHGPVQAMLFVVPEANRTTTAISAGQAAKLFGCGAEGKVAPFTDLTGIFVRSPTSGTQVLVAKNIRVPESAFKGVPSATGVEVVTKLTTYPNPQKAIGILASDAYATQRSRLNALAFQGVGQKRAYYADSDANAVDQRNVRDGHYVIQGPLHFFTSLKGDKASPVATQMVAWMTGKAPIDDKDPKNLTYIETVAKAGNVPPCAMKVTLDGDGGKFSPFTPKESCHCYFEKSVNATSAAPARCKACDTDSECKDGQRCQTGYCE